MIKRAKDALLFVLFIVGMLLASSGCAKPAVIYKEVKVPVKCDVKKRTRPNLDMNVSNFDKFMQKIHEVLEYTEGLERDLAYCRGEK